MFREELKSCHFSLDIVVFRVVVSDDDRCLVKIFVSEDLLVVEGEGAVEIYGGEADGSLEELDGVRADATIILIVFKHLQFIKDNNRVIYYPFNN